jgi:hypothetical protein
MSSGTLLAIVLYFLPSRAAIESTSHLRLNAPEAPIPERFKESS